MTMNIAEELNLKQWQYQMLLVWLGKTTGILKNNLTVSYKTKHRTNILHS